VLRISDTIQQRLLAAARPADLEACERVFTTIERALDEPARSIKEA